MAVITSPTLKPTTDENAVPISAPLPVSPLYEAPFPFGGVLHQVVFDLGDDRSGVPTSPYLD